MVVSNPLKLSAGGSDEPPRSGTATALTYLEGPVLLELVGDGGLEPPTSTMSTWRSTPELIARFVLVLRIDTRQLPRSTEMPPPPFECP